MRAQTLSVLGAEPPQNMARPVRPPHAKYPEHVVVRGKQRSVRFALKDYKSPVEFCDAVLSINPKNVQAHYIKGTALILMGKYREGIHSFRNVLKIKPKDVNAYMCIILALHDMKDYRYALEYCDIALETHSNTDWFHYTKGVVLSDMNRQDEAVKCYDEAIRLNPDLAVAYTSKAAAMWSMGDYKAALERGWCVNQYQS